MWARIEDGIVKELTDIDPSGRFHPSIAWVKCGKPVTAGMQYLEGEFYDENNEASENFSREDIEAIRLRAYADPLTGSDRYFSEALRMQAMGEEDWEAVRDQGVSRYQEIQRQYPWPEE